MKNIKEYIVNEGWNGKEADDAYDKILSVWETMKTEDILQLIWSYYSSRDLQNLYKWMEQDGYFE